MIHDHEWDETLSAYVDDDLSAEQAAAVAQHVHSCVACRRAIDDLRGVKSMLGNEQNSELAVPNGWNSLREEIAAFTRRSRILRWSAAAAAVLIISSTGVVLASRNSNSEPSSSNAAMNASLAIVDAAINDTRAALVSDPDDPFLIDYLGRLQRQRMKVVLEFSLRMSDQA